MAFGVFREFPSFDDRPGSEPLDIVDGSELSVVISDRLMTITHDAALRHGLGLAGILMGLDCGGKVHNPHEGEELSLPCTEVPPAPQ